MTHSMPPARFSSSRSYGVLNNALGRRGTPGRDRERMQHGRSSGHTPLILQRHLSRAEGLTCENVASRGTAVMSLSAPDVQVQRAPSTSAVAGLSVPDEPFSDD